MSNFRIDCTFKSPISELHFVQLQIMVNKFVFKEKEFVGRLVNVECIYVRVVRGKSLNAGGANSTKISLLKISFNLLPRK